MHPSITEQLDGIRHVLATVVAPAVDDAYVADVLAGIIGTIETLGRWAEVPAFLRDDARRTADLLVVAGITPPSPPDDPLDIEALVAHHDAVRGLLEQSMAHVMNDVDACAAMALLFAERSARFPLINHRAGMQPATRPVNRSGGSDAHPAR